MKLYSVIPQALGKKSSPIFAGLTITGNSVFGLNSSVFQPATDSTTFFQVLDADGGTPVFNVDTTNERVGIGTATPGAKIHIVVDGSGEMIKSTKVIDTLAGAANIFEKARGSVGAETIVQYNDVIGGLFARGYDGAIYEDCAAVRFKVDGTPSGSTDMPGRIEFETVPNGSDVLLARLVIKNGGNIGINEGSPETLTEWTSTVPYLTLHNSTHEDSDGGRESRLNFKGEQSGGEETTLARIEIGHDGAVDDEKGYLDIFINDGNDGDSPTHQIRVGSNGVGIGTNAPHSTGTELHVYGGSSGVTVPWTGRHNLIVEGDDTTGISILTPDNKVGSLVWGSPSDSNHAYIDCEQALNGMWIGAGGVQTMALVSGDVGIGVTDPHSKLEVAGAISSATVTITESTANLDVSGINVLFVNPGAATTITGFANGVAGQILFISAVANGQDITMVHNSGTQKVFLHTGGNETLSSEFGGWTLTCDGSNWYDTEHSKHV